MCAALPGCGAFGGAGWSNQRQALGRLSRAVLCWFGAVKIAACVSLLGCKCWREDKAVPKRGCPTWGGRGSELGAAAWRGPGEVVGHVRRGRRGAGGRGLSFPPAWLHRLPVSNQAEGSPGVGVSVHYRGLRGAGEVPPWSVTDAFPPEGINKGSISKQSLFASSQDFHWWGN